MKIIVKFKTIINLVWGNEISGREAFAFPHGFPATFYLTNRRAIVIGEFMEKTGWLRKKTFHRVIYEAGLQEIKDFKINLVAKKRIFTGYISFKPHNQIGKNAIIQFLKMRPEIGKEIENFLTALTINNPVEDTGIVLLDTKAPPPQRWLVKRFGKNDGIPNIIYP